MTQINAKEVKEKILSFLEEHGPSLPIPVARHITMNTLFVSAFLSEMASENMIKISSMKVGGSPLYYPPSKLNMLENFINHLKDKEREACLLLKEKGILEDSLQTPVIRVALRSLKDFAFPIKIEEKIFWRYFLMPEKEALGKLNPKEQTITIEEKIIEIPKEEIMIIKEEISQNPNELEIIKKELEIKKQELETIRKEIKEKTSEKPKQQKKVTKKTPENKFTEQAKIQAEKKGIEILEILREDKKEAIFLAKKDSKEFILLVLDKKKLEESDILKAHKYSSMKKLPHSIILNAIPSKKITDLLNAYKNLDFIEKIEENL